MKKIISPKNTEIQGEFLRINGAGKFQEESMVVNKDQALLLIVDLYEYLDKLKEKSLKLPLGNLHISKGKILYTEEEVKELFIKRTRDLGITHKKFNDLLLKQDLEWFEQNKKK